MQTLVRASTALLSELPEYCHSELHFPVCTLWYLRLRALLSSFIVLSVYARVLYNFCLLVIVSCSLHFVD
jgi:hypothetical protein